MVSITTVTNLVRHGCRDHSWADPPVGPSVDDLAAALADLAPFRVTSPPKDVTIYGYRGKHLELTVPDLPVEGEGDDRRFTGCADGTLKSWVAAIDAAEAGDAFYGYTRAGPHRGVLDPRHQHPPDDRGELVAGFAPEGRGEMRDPRVDSVRGWLAAKRSGFESPWVHNRRSEALSGVVDLSLPLPKRGCATALGELGSRRGSPLRRAERPEGLHVPTGDPGRGPPDCESGLIRPCGGCVVSIS